MSKIEMEPDASSKTSAQILEILSQLPLKKFYTKRLVEIVIATPLTYQDRQLVKEITETGKQYETFTDTHFVTRDDVMDLLDRLALKTDTINLPLQIKEYAQEIVVMKLLELDSLSLEFLALMTKLKIVECMYEIYTSEVKKMQRRRQVQDELTSLLKDCETQGKGDKGGKKGKKEKKGKESKSSKTKGSKGSKTTDKKTSGLTVKAPPPAPIVPDYTDIPLQENDIIFDYNVDNHVMYFVLCGFSDLGFVKNLNTLQVNISAIIQVFSDSSNSTEVENTIVNLQELFETPKATPFLVNTAYMKGNINDESCSKEKFETFLYIVRKINYIKRQHLRYIKNLKLYTYKETEKIELECLDKYNRILNSYPSELITIPLIVNAIVQEICWRETERIYSVSDLTRSTESTEINYKGPKTYQAHEEDLLKIKMFSYGETGRNCYDQTLGYLKLLQPFSEFDHALTAQFQDRSVSTKDMCYCEHLNELFDYFHLALFSQMERLKFIPKQSEEFYLTTYLVTHDQVKEYEEAIIKGFIASADDLNNSIQLYHVKEDLSSAVLRQMVFKAMKNHTCWDRIYCNESEATLLRFHDNLNRFGLDTKIWFQNLRTPICLRDFCRFVVNDEKQWLEKSQLVEHESLFPDTEECQGLAGIQVSELYQEYQYLLESKSTGISNEEKKKVFDDVLNDLLSYPKGESVATFCSENGSYTAYDLGPTICQLTGHTTIFSSDDGVKVTVDTSRFKTEDPKCAIILEADDNSLVFHKTMPSAFHFNFKDETLLSFTKLETPMDKIFLIEEELEGEQWIQDEVAEEEQGANKKQDKQQQQEQKEQEVQPPLVPNYNDYWVQLLRMSRTPNLTIQKGTINDKKTTLDSENLDRLLELFKAAVTIQQPIYKISTKPSLHYIKRTNSSMKVPLVGILKRVLFKPIRRKRKIPGYSVLNASRSKKDVLLTYDFKILLPHGLVVSTLPRNKKLAEIKQEYTYSHYKEQYRIFYSSGVIVIKNDDGTTTILRANGDIIKFTDESECSTPNCANNMSYLFEKEEKRSCPYQTTRCPHKAKFVTQPDLYEFGNIPYAKKSILQFDGKKIDLSEEKLTEKQLYYVLSEHDYHAEEVFYDREDGMKCLVDKKGRQIYQFPDGTKITAFPKIEKELIYISNKPNIEGWVSVVINYIFEHPNYLAVEYDASDGSTEILLKNAVIKNTSNALVVSIDNNLTLEVTSDSIVFLKSCASCEGDCLCQIHLDQGLKLLEVCDSYDKYFSCDHFGKCDINSSFIKGPLNKNQCDHRRSSEKQKLFVLNNQGPAGAFLWTDGSIHDKITTSKNKKNVKMSNYMNRLDNKETLEFYTDIYQNFIGQFTMTQSYSNIRFSKLKTKNEKDQSQLIYVTYRILVEFQNLAENPDIVEQLQKFVEQRQGKKGSLKSLLKGIKELIRFISSNEEDKLSYRQSITQRSYSSRSSSSASDEVKLVPEKKVDVQEIIAKWRQKCDDLRFLIRNQQFPPYFHSEYYQRVLKGMH